jgi:hypothetical protein
MSGPQGAAVAEGRGRGRNAERLAEQVEEYLTAARRLLNEAGRVGSLVPDPLEREIAAAMLEVLCAWAFSQEAARWVASTPPPLPLPQEGG